uniref:UDP-galactose transporter n=1 Tax=Meloidogyne floridensis TaxID=298350 RepID=A0A915NVQ5_9BILA
MLKQKEFEEMWTNYVINLLTSSSIIYIFIYAMEENELRMAEIDERFARLEEYRRQNEEIEEEIKNREIVMKAKLAQILRRQKANFLLFFILVSAVLIHHLYSLVFKPKNKMVTTIKNNKLKWLSLFILIAQTTALVLTLRYSRTQIGEGPKYLSSTAVLMAEIVKFITCVFVLFFQNDWSFDRLLRVLNADVFNRLNETTKIGVPALLYVDAATYQVTYQLKILTTAFFSVTMLNKKLNILKWIALLLLTGGVALVQLPKNSSKPNITYDHNSSDRLIGLFAILAACFSSGFAGVYLERILKTASVFSNLKFFYFFLIFRFNFGLKISFFSIFGAFAMTWIYDWEQVKLWGFFHGYNTTIWIVVALQAYGGLVIALVVKYADNILKGFAVSLSILLSSFISWGLLNDFEPSFTFVLGASIVILSTFLYG